MTRLFMVILGHKYTKGRQIAVDQKNDPENPFNFVLGLLNAILLSLPLWGVLGWFIRFFFS